MKKIIVLVLVLVFVFIFFLILHIPHSGENKNVLYGERPDIFKTSKNTSRWFFDKMGHLYPKERIPNSALSKHNASIKEYYKNNPAAFRIIAANYQLDSLNYSDRNFDLLQDTLSAQLLQEVNFRLVDFSNVYILIHGFRKPVISQHNTTSSFLDNLIIQSAVEQNQKSNYFIEIYWDGMYDFFEVQKRNQHLESFMLFEKEARTNAVYTGYSLRKMISQLRVPKMTILSHSLGARVALSSLVNTYDKYVPSKFQQLPTPSQDTILICLIAPAISNTPFDEYYERNTVLEFSKRDNYKLHIFYNEEDVVLQKKVSFLGPGAKRFGDTSLGCNYEQAIDKLKITFDGKYPNSEIFLIKTSVGSTHLAEHYVLSSEFRSFLNLEKGKN